MSQFDSAVAVAWEEVTFWQELAEHLKLPQPGILKAREQAWKRYEQALLVGTMAGAQQLSCLASQTKCASPANP